MKKSTLLIIIVILMLVFPFSLLLGNFTAGLAGRSVFFRAIHPNYYYYSYYSANYGKYSGGYRTGGYRGGGPGIGK